MKPRQRAHKWFFISYIYICIIKFWVQIFRIKMQFSEVAHFYFYFLFSFLSLMHAAWKLFFLFLAVIGRQQVTTRNPPSLMSTGDYQYRKGTVIKMQTFWQLLDCYVIYCLHVEARMLSFIILICLIAYFLIFLHSASISAVWISADSS